MRTGAGVATSTGAGGEHHSIPLDHEGTFPGGRIQYRYELLPRDRRVQRRARGGLRGSPREQLTTTQSTGPGPSPRTCGTRAATYDSTQFCLYLDGVLNGTCTATTQTPRSDSIQAPAIGTASDSTGALAGFFAGRVDEVRIRTVARTPAQIQALDELRAHLGHRPDRSLGRERGRRHVRRRLGGRHQRHHHRWTDVGLGAPALDGVPSLREPGVAPGRGERRRPPRHVRDSLTARSTRSSRWSCGSCAPAPGWVPRRATGATPTDPADHEGPRRGRGLERRHELLPRHRHGERRARGGLRGPAGRQYNHPFNGTGAVPRTCGTTRPRPTTARVLAVSRRGAQRHLTAVNQPPRGDSIQPPAIGTAWTRLACRRLLHGRVDEARIWNVARTAAQIQATKDPSSTRHRPDRPLGHERGAGTTAGGSAGAATARHGGPTWVAGAPARDAPLPPGPACSSTARPSTSRSARRRASGLPPSRSRPGSSGPAPASGPHGHGRHPSAVPLMTKGRAESDGSNVDMNYFLGIDNDNVLVVDFEEGAGQTHTGSEPPVTGTTASRATSGTTRPRPTTGRAADLPRRRSTARWRRREPPPRRIHPARGARHRDELHRRASGFFAGVLDEARIWNVARTDAQIADSMNASSPAGPA